MKERKIALVLLVLTLTFVGFCAGLFIGKQREPASVTIYTNRTPTTAVSESTPSESAESSASESVRSEAYVDGKLNINLATVEELTTLPGIGATLAQRIVDYRERNGSFSSVEELTNVSGIGEKRLSAILEYITVR